MDQKSFVLDVQQNEQTKDCFIEFPKEFVDQQDWRDGDTVVWAAVDESDPSRGFTLTNTSKEARKEEGLPLFVVETIISHRIRYAIRAQSASHAQDAVTMEAVEEFDQNCLGEQIFCARQVSMDEYCASFDVPRSLESKKTLIHTIEYSNDGVVKKNKGCCGGHKEGAEGKGCCGGHKEGAEGKGCCGGHKEGAEGKGCCGDHKDMAVGSPAAEVMPFFPA